MTCGCVAQYKTYVIFQVCCLLFVVITDSIELVHLFLMKQILAALFFLETVNNFSMHQSFIIEQL